uniref:transketolase family protein n=1 Tax=Vaginimicrobium propionicum TaxID=1871034 RepID=UPI0009F82487|nr:transketolase C-terminal domain-containing protein [Vaginimicrobium propionicum]
MAGFNFCSGDMGSMMESKGTVTAEILDMIEEDKRVAYINSDATIQTGRMGELMRKYPNRVLDVGIAEMNMVTMAAGLAKEGFIPFVQTFGPFLCVRALDQIHNDVAYNNYPVRLIGTHAGISSGYGPTHNTIVEFGIMNSIPNMTMIAPADAIQCRKVLRASMDYEKPIYIRIPRGEEPIVYDQDLVYEIGKAVEIKSGKDLTFIATGMGVRGSIQAAHELEKEGFDIGVIDMHTIKPIDKAAICKAASATGAIVTVEDHNILGGLGSIVADVLMDARIYVPLVKIGIPDEFVNFGYPEELYPHYGMDGCGIAATARNILRG